MAATIFGCCTPSAAARARTPELPRLAPSLLGWLLGLLLGLLLRLFRPHFESLLLGLCWVFARLEPSNRDSTIDPAKGSEPASFQSRLRVRARQKPSKDPAKTQHLGKWQCGLARRAHSMLGGLGAGRFSRHTPGNRPAGAACSFSRLAHKPPSPHRPFAAILRGHLPTCFPALLGQKKSFC